MISGRTPRQPRGSGASATPPGTPFDAVHVVRRPERQRVPERPVADESGASPAATSSTARWKLGLSAGWEFCASMDTYITGPVCQNLTASPSPSRAMLPASSSRPTGRRQRRATPPRASTHRPLGARGQPWRASRPSGRRRLVVPAKISAAFFVNGAPRTGRRSAPAPALKPHRIRRAHRQRA